MVRNLLNWLARRFSPGERFGLSLSIGLIASVLAGWAFGALADAVVESELAGGIDQSLGQAILHASTWVGSILFFSITNLASVAVILPAFLLIAFWLYKNDRRRDILIYTAAVAGGLVINLTLKSMFGRPRPLFDTAFYSEIGYSFPSGHAMLSFLFYGMTAYLLAQAVTSWRQRMGLFAIAILLIVLISFSRLYLGVHYITDIAGGWAAGAAWMSACITARRVAFW